MSTIRSWVIGRSGLLGSAVVRSVAKRSLWELLPPQALPWGESSFEHVARTQAQLFAEDLDSGVNAVVIWAAGAAVTSASGDALDRELREFSVVLEALTDSFADCPARLTVFYPSSVGGVYGGSRNPPFDENTEPIPISDYGRFKLAAEKMLRELSRDSGIRTTIGRIANLYGPGQKLGKMQGLVSHLSLAQLTAKPASIFVPLDTLRDYIYVDDCAELILDLLERAVAPQAMEADPSITKILATGSAASIAELIGHFGRISHGHPNVMIGASPFGVLQSLDLRVRSVMWPDLDKRALTPLPVGIKATLDDILTSLQRPTSSFLSG